MFSLFDERAGLVVLTLAGLLLTVVETRTDATATRLVALVVALTGALVIVPQVLSYLVAPVLRSRSALPLLPALLLAAAYGFSRAGRAGTLLVGLLATSQLVVSTRAVLSDIRSEQWREIAEALRARIQPGDLVIADQRWLWHHYLGDSVAVTAPGDLDVDAVPSAWLLLGHDLEDPAPLAAFGGPSRDVVTLHGAALHQVGPLARPLRFTLVPGSAGLVDGPRVELWGAGSAETGALRASGRCAIVLDATEDAAGTEPARLHVVLRDGPDVLLDTEMVVGGGPSPAVDLGKATDVHLAITFVNDAVIDGKDRNAHVRSVRLRCE